MRIHHVGYVVNEIDRYAAAMPGLSHVKTVEDPPQHARLSLYSVGEGSLVELIQPHGPKAYTWCHLSLAGEGLHHICYEGLEAAEVDSLIAQSKMLKVLGPVHAGLFDRPVIFAVTRHRSIVEFIL